MVLVSRPFFPSGGCDRSGWLEFQLDFGLEARREVRVLPEAAVPVQSGEGQADPQVPLHSVNAVSPVGVVELEGFGGFAQVLGGGPGLDFRLQADLVPYPFNQPQGVSQFAARWSNSWLVIQRGHLQCLEGSVLG